jgi:hypothetical protein
MQQQQQLHTSALLLLCTYVRVVQRREEWPQRTNQNSSFVVRGAKTDAFLTLFFFLLTVEGVEWRKERKKFVLTNGEVAIE